MSSIPLCFLRFGRVVAENHCNYNTAIVNRYAASYSSYRNFWNNIINRKSAPATAAPSSQSKTTNTEESDTPEAANTDAPEAQSSLELQITQLKKSFAELKQKNEELTDKYKRALADGENLRIRLTKRIEEAKIFGIQGFCKDLLEVADVLSKATECVPKEEVSDNNPHLKNLYEGLTMTETELKRVFTRHGLTPINPINEKFDPNFHEALFEQEVEGKQAGTVVVVSKVGYKLQDRVIRPALVGVSK